MENRITPEFAQRVVTLLHEITGSNVNVMGPGGVIIASMQPERIGTVHDGARQIMAGEANELAISAEQAAQIPGAKAGFNGPIDFNGERVGCIGISGDPERVRPMQKLAAVIVQEELAKIAAGGVRAGVLLEIAGQIEGIADQIRVVAINGSIQAAKLGEKGGPFKTVVGEMSKLAEEITKLLAAIRREADKRD